MADLGIVFKSSIQSPEKMLKISSGLERLDWNGKPVDYYFPLKSPKEIINKIINDDFTDISIIEWVCLFSEKDLIYPEGLKENQIIFRIFKAIVRDPIVANLLLFRAAMAIEGYPNSLPNSMQTRLHYLKGTLGKLHTSILDIVLAAQADNFEEVSLSIIHKSIQPNNLFQHLGLSNCVNIRSNVHQCIHRTPTLEMLDKYEEWYCQYLHENNKNNKINLINEIALNKEVIKKYKKLINRISNICDPSVNNSLWSDLSDESRMVLSKVFRLSDYYKVRDIIKLLEKEEVSHALDISDIEISHLRRRTFFWKNYQEKILSIRVLLPFKTYSLLGKVGKLAGWYDVMKNELHSEVLIIEFNDILIVDVLRGLGTEWRIFNKLSRNINLLQHQEITEIDQIRKMYQDDEHDHELAWQWAAEKELREKYRLKVDEGVTWFAGLNEEYGAYNSKTGLPTPSKEILEERNMKIESWWHSFFKSEEKLGKYGSSAKTDINCKRLLEARQQGRLGKKQLMRKHLEDAASEGDITAIVILVNDFLLGAKRTQHEREQGEHWYKKLQSLAKQGNGTAIEFLEIHKKSS